MASIDWVCQLRWANKKASDVKTSKASAFLAFGFGFEG
jgi:hypothetical protein